MKPRKILSFFILTAITIFLSWYLWQRRELFYSLRSLNLASFSGLLLLQCLALMLNGLFIKILVRVFGITLQAKEWFGLATITAVSNYIAPFSGGALIRAAYLKKRHHLEFSRFAILLAANYLVNFWVISLAGCLTVLFFYVQQARLMLLFFGTSLTLLTILALLPPFELPGDSSIATKCNWVLDGWRVIRHSYQLLGQLALIATTTNLLHITSFWYANRALGFPLSLPAALLISLTSTFAVVIKLTPANLGVYESVIALSTSLLGLDPGQGLAAALVIRGAALLPIFLFGTIFMHILSREITRKN